MEKKKKWQLFLILSVIILTLYNILPTVFYYLKPLKNPITETQAVEISASIAKRIKNLETETSKWLHAFCDSLHVKPTSITAENQTFVVTFAKSEEAAKLRRFLPRAGSLIPFAPAQLRLAPQEENPKEVVIQRQVPAQLSSDLFSFAAKDSALYRETIIDRAAQIAYSLAGPTESAFALNTLDPRYLDTLASQIHSIAELNETHKTLANRFATQFTQGPFTNRSKAVEALISAFDQARDELKGKKGFEKQELNYIQAKNFLKNHLALFASGQDPLDLEQIKQLLTEKNLLVIGNRNPIFSELKIDWTNGQILLKKHKDLAPVQQPLINEVAKVARFSNEELKANDEGYFVDLHELNNLTGFLVLDMQKLARIEGDTILSTLQTHWHPQHPDLQNLTLVHASNFEALPFEQKAMCLVVSTDREPLIHIKGFDQILQKTQSLPNSESAQLFAADFKVLNQLLGQNGYYGYQGAGQELIYQKGDFSRSLLLATREEFAIKGTRKFATLELSDLEQRLQVENKIDTQIHEELIKWRDEFNSAQVNPNPALRFDVPKPTRNVWLNNLALTWKKFFRGDAQRVLKWGLDLSGGKTVQIELRDNNQKVVTNEEDIKQGINELYARVNKMGVSEVVIRQLGNNIVLDFPGSQSLSAAELIKASSMYFHVVNEKFSNNNPTLADPVNRFLQEVWNEAVVTNRRDIQSINTIAWNHLHGESISETARTLLENGLVLSTDLQIGQNIDDATSKIVKFRGTEYSEWHGQTHPLLITFRNYALEGSQLEHIQANYDPQKGNYLSFEIQAGAARNQIHAWTSRYSEEKIMGTELAEFSKARGWRMAVVLNDAVISAPSLNAVLRDSASISGSFSQREVNQLASDLKAGSLTFTPHILSEKNVSPELGQKDRVQGITATMFALLLVIASMVIYYRFAGMVASVAVLFNLLILWATLQNMGATLSLAGIAGIILTVGMAVDANVLVFERVKEEFAITGKISTAIAAGYKKAYTAIIDSNVTTIIAALILLNFDAGPIKGFAITLIIGIVSSMFTALFMTRYYFAGWVENPKNQALKMANWFQAKSIDFLKHAKLSFVVAAAIIVVGSGLVYSQRTSIFGMDFTGGYSLHLEVEPRENTNYIETVEQALIAQGASARDFQIRELNPANHLRVLFANTMQQEGKPFYNLVQKSDENPYIQWVVQALGAKGISLTKNSLVHLESNWTAMSGQMSSAMRNNALVGLLISFICIFIYIAFRFEYKFAAASVVCLLHDVLITIGFIGILHALGVPVQIDMNTIAALMTIIGYSLNDTIIIFDRIREEMSLSRRKSLPQIVNHSLNTTLSRTTITSGTTLLVLIALVILGGSSVFSFALVMTIGVFFGTLSSWYIASPLMLFFHKREEKDLKFVVD